MYATHASGYLNGEKRLYRTHSKKEIFFLFEFAPQTVIKVFTPKLSLTPIFAPQFLDRTMNRLYAAVIYNATDWLWNAIRKPVFLPRMLRHP